MNEFLRAALEYEAMGYSIIPCNPSNEEGKGKKPLIKWEQYQKEKASPDKIREWWTKWPRAMIGVICGISGVFVLDADSELAKEKLDSLLPENFLCPIVKTPRGYHYWFKYQQGIHNSNNGLIHCRGEGGYIIVPPSVREDGSTYSWMIELSKSLPPPAPPLSLHNIYKDNAELQNRKKQEYRPYNSLQSLHFLTLGRRDDDLFHLANHLIKSKYETGLTYKVLEIVAKNCNPPYPENEIKTKIESAISRVERRERNLADEVFRFIDLTFSYFSLTETKIALQILTSEEINNLYVIMNRMVKDGILQRHPNKNGVYRKTENTAEEIDIFKDSDNPLNLKYPLKIEELVHTMPKSIIIIAGESDAGKTAFLLNFTYLNLDNYPITYFSSEMGPTELKDRISKLPRNLKDWKNVSFKDRGSNFQDVIEPNKINIIDYLELADDFYKVGGQIKAIFDKLDKGIALIALQKKIGSELARGGDFTMEKARLYITLSRNNICKIIKAKNWQNPTLKPTGKIREFMLYKGCEFHPKSDWKFEHKGDQWTI